MGLHGLVGNLRASLDCATSLVLPIPDPRSPIPDPRSPRYVPYNRSPKSPRPGTMNF